MGKRKRGPGRCVKKNPNVNIEAEELVQAPHSFVIHKGLPGGNTLDLTKDFRKVMEPFTASSLKERKKNSIKDFVSVAGPLHVSHLSIFSRTELGMYLKLCRLPRGPTLTFKIHNFSLSRDVVSSLKKQLVVEDAFKHSPLLVLNSFSGEGMHMKLMASMFQNMFPTLNITDIDLANVRRCVLLNYNPETKLIEFRHYNIKVAPVGISKGVKKIVQGKIPNLSRCNNISEFFAKTGMLSESEAEDDPSNHITLPQKLKTRGTMEAGKSAIRLTELGPRLSLQLIKIEDGLMDGEVLYHDLVHKSEEEILEIHKRRELKKKIKEKRKKIQERNTTAKEENKQNVKEKSIKGMQKGKSETDILMQKASREAFVDAPVADDDDKIYFREEVGEEPDNDMFSTSHTGVKRPKTFHSFKNKRMKLDDNAKQSEERKPFKKSNKDFGKGGKKFAGNKKFSKNKRGGVDKTNSQTRDHRPIGGGKSKFVKRNQGRK